MTPARLDRREVVWAWFGAALVSGAFVAIAAVAGALGIARNDDWSFLANAFQFHRTGVFAVAGWVQMTLIGQLVLAWPVIAVFGESVVALQLLVAGLGIVLLASSYLFARTLVGRRPAIVVAITLGFGPLFGSLATSFMTDLPSAALQVLTLLLAVRALRTTPASKGWLIAASAVGVYAFSIREYSIAALAALWLVVLLGRARWAISWTFLAVWTAALAMLGVAIVTWRGGQVTDNASVIGFNPMGLEFVSWLPLTIGCLLLPVTAFLNPVKVLRAAWRASAVLTTVALIVVVAFMAHARLALLGNYLTPAGGYTSVVRGDAEWVVPLPIWAVFVVCGVISTIVLTGLAVTGVQGAVRALRMRADSPIATRVSAEAPASIAAAFVLVSMALYTVIPMTNSVVVFDRYLLALVPIAGALVAWQGDRLKLAWEPSGRLVGWSQLGLFVLVSLLVLTSTAAVDGARWRFGETIAAQQGLAPGNVDAGFDWFRAHSNGVATAESMPPRWTWWTTGTGRAACVTVMYADHPVDPYAAGPDPDAQPIAQDQAWTLLGQPRRLVAFAGPDNCQGNAS